jgi:hypothetical protein
MGSDMQKHRWHSCSWLCVLIATLLGLVACTRPDDSSALPPASMQKVFQVQGRIQQGPDAGLNLSGDLRPTLTTSKRLQGTLIRESGSPITVTGQIDGLAIHLAFDLGNNAAVLGVGTLQHDLNNAEGTTGGLLTGPQAGDSGDWFARWTTITTPATPLPARPTSNGDNNLPIIELVLASMLVIATLMAGLMLRVALKNKSFYARTRGQSIVPFVKASAQTIEPQRWADEATLPLAQFATTYAHGDDHYDLSFAIESARGGFLGECGVGISAALNSGKSKSGSVSDVPAWLESLATDSPGTQHQAVTALEVWLFDKDDINTVTKVLRTAQGFYNPSRRSSRNPVNDVLVIEPDQLIVLETKALRMRVKVTDVNYFEDPTHAQSVFKQVALQLAVWVK